MIHQKLSTIEPPPSIDDILSSKADDDRLGRVDFTSRLAPEVEPDPEPVSVEPTMPGATVLTRVIDTDESLQSDEDIEDEARFRPVILPVANLDEIVVPDVVTDVMPEVLAEAEPAIVPAAAQAPADQVVVETLIEEFVEVPDEPFVEEKVALSDGIDAVAAAEFQEIQDPLETMVEQPVEETVSVEETVLVEESAPAAHDEELHYLGLSVEEVAEQVIQRMREAGDASRRHLESIEAEAARRCELLTAQAELDAELIRLHARREAHAIITAARMRAGGGTTSHEDSRRLNEIGETFSRFAESIETTVAQAPGSPEHPQTR